jgi:hypothetical protein
LIGLATSDGSRAYLFFLSNGDACVVADEFSSSNAHVRLSLFGREGGETITTRVARALKDDAVQWAQTAPSDGAVVGKTADMLRTILLDNKAYGHIEDKDEPVDRGSLATECEQLLAHLHALEGTSAYLNTVTSPEATRATRAIKQTRAVTCYVLFVFRRAIARSEYAHKAYESLGGGKRNKTAAFARDFMLSVSNVHRDAVESAFEARAWEKAPQWPDMASIYVRRASRRFSELYTGKETLYKTCADAGVTLYDLDQSAEDAKSALAELEVGARYEAYTYIFDTAAFSATFGRDAADEGWAGGVRDSAARWTQAVAVYADLAFQVVGTGNETPVPDWTGAAWAGRNTVAVEECHPAQFAYDFIMHLDVALRQAAYENRGWETADEWDAQWRARIEAAEAEKEEHAE